MLDTEAILNEHCSDVADDAIRDYLKGTLSDNSLDIDALKDVLTQFLEDESVVDKIVQDVVQRREGRRKKKKEEKVGQLPPRRLDGYSVENSSVSTLSPESVPEPKCQDSTKKTKRLRSKVSKRKPKKRVENDTEDDASAWQQCKEQNEVWGGRGRGGRGAYAGRVNSIRSNIHLDAMTVSLPDGSELLTSAVMDITAGHRYGLVGRNGCGKSTLLHRLAAMAIPGLPSDMRVLLVEQKQHNFVSHDQSTLDTLMAFDSERLWMLGERERLEGILQEGTADDTNETVQLLSDLEQDLEDLEAETAEQRAEEILKGLQFTPTMINGPVQHLSGGWRMRLAIAQALFVQSDLILLDEVTNHLDLHGLQWLIQYINQSTKTIIVVSHDPAFLDAICTDIIVMAHQRLDHHVGSYSQYRQQVEEVAKRDAQILDSAQRQRAKAQAFVQKQQALANKKSADPNKQRQAKMIRDKKMDRIGNFRDDGKRYKLYSLKQLDMKSARLAQKVQIEEDEAIVQLNFPDPSWPPSIAPGGAIVRLEDLSFGYERNEPTLKNLTLQLTRKSKVALVGPNGCGKSTLMKLVGGEHNGVSTWTKGGLWVHPNLRIGHLTQYSVEELDAYSNQTVLEYSEDHIRSGSLSAAIIAKASGNIRQYLGAFGLGGRHAMEKIGHLSGGERMRLCFAKLLSDEPHLLLLDESTNHVDLETLESMTEALNTFDGSILMVSHNQAFLRGFCNELWVLEEGHVTVNHNDTMTFDEMFTQYRKSVFLGEGSLSVQRQQKTVLARRAKEQRTGARENAALI